MSSQRKFILITASILILSLLIRVYDLTTNPPGLFSDEAAIGYNAYKILHTGKDEYGVPFPIFFRSFGAYRLPVPIYANIPVIALFGLNEFSVRFTAVIFGLINILFTILLTSKVLGNKAGLLAGLIMGILPWHIHMSRIGSEYIYFPALLSVAVYFYFLSFEKKSLLVLAFIFFGLTMYTYYPTLFITPIFLTACIIVWFVKNKLKNFKYLFFALIVFVILCIPLYYGYKSGEVVSRWKDVKNTKSSFKEKLQKFKQIYKDSFSLDFLFVKGDIDFKGQFISRHSVRGFGELYLFQLPLLMIGLIVCFLKRKDIKVYLIFILLLLYPLGSAITNDGPYATRSIIGIIPLSVIPAVGLNKIFELVLKFKNKALQNGVVFLIFVLIIFSLFKYSLAFFRDYPSYSADFWGWQFGPKAIMAYFLKVRTNYDEMYMTGNFNAADIFLKFYDPNNICKNCFIGGVNNIKSDKKQLFALRVEELAQFRELNQNLIFNLVTVIKYPNQTDAYFIGEFF